MPRPVRAVLAVLLTAATFLYASIWIWYSGWESQADLGIHFRYGETPPRSLDIGEVEQGSAAEQAGLRPDDRIVEVNGRGLDTLDPYFDAVARGRPGDVVQLKVERAGVSEPLVLDVVLLPSRPLSLLERAEREIVRLYPISFLAVGLLVLFLRLEDRNAWLLALLLVSFSSAAPLFQIQVAPHPVLRAFVAFYGVAFSLLLPGIFCYFFAVFPISSPLDRRLPRLKWLWLAAGTMLAVAFALLAVKMRNPFLLHVVARASAGTGGDVLFLLTMIYFIGGFVLGVGSLVWNVMRAPDPEARRKIHIIVLGTLVSLTATLLLLAGGFHISIEERRLSLRVTQFVFLPLILIPVSFAYAVAKHRVLEIPVLLKRSARYLLVQRGSIVLLGLLSVAMALLFAVFFARFLQPRTEASLPAAIGIAVVFGSVLFWTGTNLRKRITVRIDRAFFRSAYDARLILQELAEKARTAPNRQELAALLERHLNKAFHPRLLAVYLETSEGELSAESGRVPPGLEIISSTLPELVEVTRRGEPWEAPLPGERDANTAPILASLEPECLVPMLGRDGHLSGLLVMGQQLSEEPYFGEDKKLLAAIASQTGIALESIRLAENMAKRLEAERRAAYEMEIAQEVQRRLFPQTAPRLGTLEYAADCLPARAVGGDYYDYLVLSAGQVALVLGDISGKGISGALLMANLQASIRSQSGIARNDLRKLLESVNHLLYESTEPGHYATLFFAVYEDATRRLRYANCGHSPPVLLRHTGQIERLAPTATVLGLFATWACSLGEVQLAPGDTLVVFSDGVTEALSDAEEEFGDARLVHAVVTNRHLSASLLLRAIISTVQEFSGPEQEDDLTLLIAQAR